MAGTTIIVDHPASALQYRPPQDRNDPAAPLNAIPCSIEAEQALLGIILYDFKALDQLPEGLQARHFYEPFHQRMFASIEWAVGRGLSVDPIPIAEEFRGDAAFQELGEIRYLADLVDHAPPTHAAPSYVAMILDSFNRRELLNIAAEITARAHRADTFLETESPAQQIISHVENRLMGLQAIKPREQLVSIGQAFRGVLAYLDDTTSKTGMLTCLPPLDKKLGPMLPGDMIMLAGRPSMGKSALGVTVCSNVSAPAMAYKLHDIPPVAIPQPMGVIELHGEMTYGDETVGGQTARRHGADLGHALYGDDFPTYKQMRDKHVSQSQRAMMNDVAAYIDNLPIFGVKRTGLTIASLRAIVRRQRAAFERQGVELGMVMIDHVGLLRGSEKTRGRYEEQTEIAIALKELADEMKVVILALVQLSRQIESREDKRPMLSDMRDTGAWEENADAVLMCYREAYYAAREKEPKSTTTAESLKWAEWDRARKSRTIEILVPKLREGDAGDSANLWASLPHNAVRGIEPDLKGRMF